MNGENNNNGKYDRQSHTVPENSWEKLFSDAKKVDDIEIHSLEDLGLDDDGIDFSGVTDADNSADVTRVYIPPEKQKILTDSDETKTADVPETPDAETHSSDNNEVNQMPENTTPPPADNQKNGKAKKKKIKKKKTAGRRIFKALLVLVLAAVIAVCAYVGYVIATTPSIKTSQIYEELTQSSIIYDDEGEVLEAVASAENRTNVSYEDLPANLVNAFVAVEDKTFFTHHGFNIVRIFGAIKDSIVQHKGIGGTSTITQQLARNIYLTNERSITRKIREAYYTVILERELTKEQIMEVYLNTIPLGFGSYGVQAAAQSYFGCNVQDLTLAECATLASLPKSPSNYAPLKRYEAEKVEAENPDIIIEDGNYVVVYDDTFKDRQELVLKFMLEQGLISQAEHDQAVAEDMKANMHPSSMSASKVSSYFGDYCVSEVISDLVEELNYDEERAKDLVYAGGLRIYSTLNVRMQNAAEEEFSNISNFPRVSSFRKQSGTGNILSDSGNIILYSKNTYFNSDGTFTLQPDEFMMNPNGDLVILKGHRLNIYSVTGPSGNKMPQIEFKNMYIIRDGIFYSINGGYFAGIDEQYLSQDADGNAIINSQFLAENPDYFIFGNSTVSIGPAHYTLHQETIQPQSAMVVTDHSNGQIKVMVGGRSLSGRLLYNRTTSTRQPGSSIKPIAVYGPAIQTGADGIPAKTNSNGIKYWTAGTTIEDSENYVNGKLWPKNAYSGYKGWVTLRTCVENSINVCSVRLLEDIGISTGLKYLKANGITSVVESGNVNDMNLAALALGGMTKGISPIEMASAYGTFPNGGMYVESCSYTKVTDSKGNVILEKNPETNRVFDEGVAYIMTDILRTTVTNGIAGRAAIGNQPVGGKTGTTSDNMDAWFVGFTPQYSASLWIGNDVNIQLSQGSSAAASLWSKVMRRVCEGIPYGSFKSRPSNVYASGGEYYITGTSPSGPAPGTGSEELLTDEFGRSYYIDAETGETIYVDAERNPIDSILNIQVDENGNLYVVHLQTGEKIYIDAAGNPIDNPSDVPGTNDNPQNPDSGTTDPDNGTGVTPPDNGGGQTPPTIPVDPVTPPSTPGIVDDYE